MATWTRRDGAPAGQGRALVVDTGAGRRGDRMRFLIDMAADNPQNHQMFDVELTPEQSVSLVDFLTAEYPGVVASKAQ